MEHLANPADEFAGEWIELRPGTWVKGFPSGGRWPTSETGHELRRRYVALALPIVRRALQAQAGCVEALARRRAG